MLGKKKEPEKLNEEARKNADEYHKELARGWRAEEDMRDRVTRTMLITLFDLRKAFEDAKGNEKAFIANVMDSIYRSVFNHIHGDVMKGGTDNDLPGSD